MNKKLFSIIVIFSLILVIPSANAQLTIGGEANQESIEIELDKLGNVNVKHVISSSKSPVTVNLFAGEISNLSIINENGEEKEKGVGNDGKGNQSVVIFASNQKSIIQYNLENQLILIDNLWNFKTTYPETFSILFSKEIKSIFLNDSLIQLGENKGISVNTGGQVKVEYYSEVEKIIEQVEWEENKFDVEITSNLEIKNFNFEQISKSLDFEINEKNEYVTIEMSEELLGGPYVILLDNDKIRFSKVITDEKNVLLTIKPQSEGKIIIIGTTVIPEFSMFLPLIMGFLIVLTVPFMKKFNLH